MVTTATINPKTNSTTTQTDSIELSARKSVLVSKCKYLRFYFPPYATRDIQANITSHTEKKRQKNSLSREKNSNITRLKMVYMLNYYTGMLK